MYLHLQPMLLKLLLLPTVASLAIEDGQKEQIELLSLIDKFEERTAAAAAAEAAAEAPGKRQSIYPPLSFCLYLLTHKHTSAGS